MEWYNRLGAWYNYVVPDPDLHKIQNGQTFRTMQRFIDKNLKSLQDELKTVNLEQIDSIEQFDESHSQFMKRTDQRSGWKVRFFKKMGVVQDTSEFPVLTKFLTKFDDLFFNVSLSVMMPGAKIPPHVGASQVLLKFHVPIYIPKGDVAIESNGQVYRWNNTDTLLFNDTLLHQAWNNTEEPRLILMMDYIREDVRYLQPVTPVALKLAELMYRWKYNL